MPEITDFADETRGSDQRGGSPTRRNLLRGAVIAGVAVPVLAACGSDDEPSSSGSDPSAQSSGNGDDSSSSGGGAGADVIASTGDVPEGGGLILGNPGIVITQPAAGDFKGFTNICTHQSCPLDNVSDGTINCVCHGSQ